jgi:hypothetical protein
MTILTHAPQHMIVSPNAITDNDSLSCSSTLPVVDRALRKPQDADYSSVPSSPSRIRFDLERNVVHHSTKEYDEIHEQWLERKDYAHMRDATRLLARQAVDHDRTILENVSYRTVMLKAFHACRDATKETDSCQLGRKDEALLKKYLTNAFRVGMEAMVVMSIQADKVARRKKIVSAVLEAQANVPSDLSEHHKADFIRRVSEDVSRTSRLLATRIAFKQVGLSS